MITKDYLKTLFDYKNGNLYWKERRGGKVVEGSKAGSYNKSGYFNVSINKKTYRLHRMIFMWHHGFLPKEVDHINSNKLDNRIQNLRAATKSENLRNAKVRKTNSSGYKNVAWRKDNKTWAVALRHNGKVLHIGFFKDLELADLVAQEARNKYHGSFARHK